MTDTVGFPLSDAKALLSAEGFPVRVSHVRSKKGTGGTDERVVRQTVDPDGTAHLTTAEFITSVEA